MSIQTCEEKIVASVGLQLAGGFMVGLEGEDSSPPELVEDLRIVLKQGHFGACLCVQDCRDDGMGFEMGYNLNPESLRAFAEAILRELPDSQAKGE
jgi:hypothetical protein